MRFLSSITLCLALLATTAGCGGTSPIQPPPPPPPSQLQLSCPVSLTREATRPDGAEVHWDAPTTTGGREPYVVQCEPGSGGIFAVGESSVRCTVTDADMAQASCGFSVTVLVSQTLAKTRFLAFGDSITEGKISLAPVVSLAEVDTYPYQLEQMLLQRYPSQVFAVTNSGVGGERTPQGAQRLPGVIDSERPEVVLLLEGVNAVRELSTSSQVAALSSMISTAQRQNVEVIIATLMPISAAREADKRGTLAKIIALNTRIFQLADEYRLGNVVDLYALFDANPHLLGADGLHPTAEGQTRIAEAFNDEIVRRYESRATMTSRLRGLPARDAR